MDTEVDLRASNGLAIIISFLCIAVLFIIMGRRKPYDPRDYKSIDLETAASESIRIRSESSDISTGSGQRGRRPRKQRRHQAPTAEDVPLFWVVCPCKDCERHRKPRTRLYSTVLRHIKQHLMGEIYKVLV
jgi:hypothetical protein